MHGLELSPMDRPPDEAACCPPGSVKGSAMTILEKKNIFFYMGLKNDA
jgi:hypothetical protein